MLRRVILYGLLVAAIGAYAWVLRSLLRDTAVATHAPRPMHPAVARQALRVGPPARPRPDARVLIAVGDVHALLRHRGREDATATFADGVWHVLHRGREVGVLPEFPTFRDARALLVGWAATLGAADTLAAAASHASYAGIDSALWSLRAIQAADAADRRWSAGERDPALLLRASNALTLLTAETVDETEIGDRLPARALAIAVVCAARDSDAAASDLCLLASLMGYHAEAFELAGTLPPAHPIRQFVRREDHALLEGPLKGPHARLAQFLAMRRAAERYDTDAWDQLQGGPLAADGRLALPILATSLRLHRFETVVPTGVVVLMTVAQDLKLHALASVRNAGVAPTHPLGDLLTEFERAMDDMPASADGALLDREVLRAYYRASVYGALFEIGEFARTQLSSARETAALAIALSNGNGSDGPNGELERWYWHLAAHKLGRIATGALHADLTELAHFGAALPLCTYDALAGRMNDRPQTRRALALDLGSRFDTRPDHLWHYGHVLHEDGIDLVPGDRLMARAVIASHPLDFTLRSWWAGFNGDRATFDRLLARTDVGPDVLVGALDNGEVTDAPDSPAVRRAYRRCIEQDPDHWYLTHAYVRYLRRVGGWDEMRSVTERWLARPRHSVNAFDATFARIALSEALEHQGQHEQSLEAIEGAVKSLQFGAMARTSEALARLGRIAEAETLAVRAWRRYPDWPDAQVLAVGMMWRRRDFGHAAAALAAARFPLDVRDWRWTLGPVFVRRFARSREIGRAVDSLAAHGLDGILTLGGLAEALDDSGYAQRAFDVGSRIRAEGRDTLDKRIRNYAYMTKARGAAAALAWFEDQGPFEGSALGYVDCVAFARHHDELVWALPLPTDSPESPEFIWLMRAAISLRHPDDHAHDAELSQHFGQPSASRYRLLGRCLLGHESEETVLASATDARAKCETFYYLGLRAEHEGDYTRAAQRYTQCLDTGQDHNGEYLWAFERLNAWGARWQSLELIARLDHATPAKAAMAHAE